MCLALLMKLAAGEALAATPSSGTLSALGQTVNWTGAFMTPTGGACSGPNNSGCDNFSLTINYVPPPGHAFKVAIVLTPSTGGDWDLETYYPNGSAGPTSGNSAGQAEMVTLTNPPSGTYTVAAAPFAPTPIEPSYTASATLSEIPSSPPGTEPVTYTNYDPNPLGRSAGEPSIGSNWNTDAVMYIASLQTIRLRLDECSSPAKPTWADVSFETTSTASLDPILFTDHITGRTFVSQLSGTTSLMAYSDNDGQSWTPTEGGAGTSGVDHQTVGGGIYHAPIPQPPPPAYPHAVYYCSQDIADALCSRSDDGGASFGPTVPIYTIADCGGIHGHVKVSPLDGTVYVPNMDCGEQAVVVSEDNGLTWAIRRIPGSSPPLHITDPSVAVANDGTVYFGYSNGGIPKIAVSHDKGVTWVNDQQIGASLGIQQSTFPAVVAGDGDRAAFAFLGSTAPGDGTGSDAGYPGVWYVYVAHTYDGGQTWTVVNAAPNDPVQRGTICNEGTGCNCCRNLLDFNDATIDRTGHVLVAYSDGCDSPGCINGSGGNDNTAIAKIARQVNGRRMFSPYDMLTVPAAPLATGATAPGNPSLARFNWSTPDDHGSAITGYRIYRRTQASGFELRASLPATQHAFDDPVNPAESYFYKVSAVNAEGEGPFCDLICISQSNCPALPEDACVVPGLTVVTDPPGDVSNPGTSQSDILQIWASGIYTTDGPDRLVLSMQVDNLSSVPANGSWRVQWTSPDNVVYFVSMDAGPTGTVTYSYGTYNATTGYTSQGAADGSFTADGRITITVPTGVVGSPIPNQALLNMSGISQVLVGAPQGGGVLVTLDTTDPGSYICHNCGASGSPVAGADFGTTPADTPVTIDVLANDSDPQNQPLTVLSVTDPPNGTSRNNGDGTVTYTPNSGFNGTDTFTYTVGDTDGNSSVGSVTVIVGPCSADPVFNGIQSVTSPGNSSCGLDLSWNPGYAVCSGVTVRYNVYRSTNPNFNPTAGNMIALRLTGTTYHDHDGLANGTTYYYIVRAEDTSTGHGGPGNGGSEDNNTVKLSGVPRGPLVPGASFSDNFEGGLSSSYAVTTTRTNGPSVLPDATAHSLVQSLFMPDDQPGSPTLTYRDDSVALPPMNISSTTEMTFWHNFDLARFNAIPNVQDAAYRSGAVLEISADGGNTWRDLGADANGNLLPYIDPPGRRYNGTVTPSSNEPQPKPLNNQKAWVGSSDGDTNVHRTDAMAQVTVHLGQAIQAFYGVSSLANARVRFHLGGSFQALIGGVQGTGWGIDDIAVSNLLSPGPCTTAPTGAGSVARLYVAKSGSQLLLTWEGSCRAADNNYAIYEGTIGSWYSHVPKDCNTGNQTSKAITPAAGNKYYLVVAHGNTSEGSYGQRSNGTERPQATTPCQAAQVIACP